MDNWYKDFKKDFEIDGRRGKLGVIYAKLDKMTARSDTENVKIWGLSRMEYDSLKSLGSAFNMPQWKAFSKVCILGAGRLYHYIAGKEIDLIHSLLYRLEIISSAPMGEDLGVSFEFSSGDRMFQSRLPWEFIEWVNSVLVRQIEFSRSKCLRLCYLVGLTRVEDVEGVKLPEVILIPSEGVENRFKEYVSNLYEALKRKVMWYWIYDGDKLKDKDLKSFLGVKEARKLVEIISMFGGDYNGSND